MNKWEQYNFETSVKKVFANKAGKQLLDFLIDVFVLRRSWHEGKTDTTAFYEGQKDLVLTLKNLMEKQPESASNE